MTGLGSVLGLFQPLDGLRKRTFHGSVSRRRQFWTVFPSEISPHRDRAPWPLQSLESDRLNPGYLSPGR